MNQSSDRSTIDKYRQAFQEEAREILTDLESALLELNENRGDKELVGRAFRDLHTIKGSGAMFGFDGLAGFAHNLETAYDEVRSGRLQVTAELIDLTLAALDQIKAMLEAPEGSGSTIGNATAEILLKLRRLTGLSDTSRCPVAPAAPPATSPETPGVVRDWNIHFLPGPDLLRNGANPLLLLQELSPVGQTAGYREHGRSSPARRIRPRTLLHRVGNSSGYLCSSGGDS